MKTDAKCRIDSVNCVELLVKFGSLSELTARSVSLLQDSDGGVHGKTEFVGPWPSDIAEQFSKLKASIEKHLLAFHFETTKGVTADTEQHSTAPTGIFGERRRPSVEDDVDDL